MTELEDMTKHVETCQNLTMQQRRLSLFNTLDSIIAFSEEKRKFKTNSDKSKLSWARVSISAIAVYGNLIKDEKLEEIGDVKEEFEDVKTTWKTFLENHK